MTQYLFNERKSVWWLSICTALLLALTSLGTAQAQDQVSDAPLVPPAATAPIFEDFETTCPPTDWNIFSQDTDTANTWECDTFNGDTSLSANGFGNSAAADEWVITPEIDFSGLTTPTATFETWTRFSDGGIAYPQLEFLYSTDYDGAGDIDTATWTSLSYTPSPEDSQVWTPSGNVDLSSIGNTTAYFAFRYQSSGTGGGSAAWWQVDDFRIDEPPPPAVVINELGVSDTGPDAEFFELFGVDGTSLDGVYLVALHATDGSSDADRTGKVITVLDLNANSIQADGFFVGSSPEADATYNFTSDYAFADNTFTNAPSTYGLVYAPSGLLLAAGDDLDTDDDGTLDIVPWDTVLSSVALTEGANTETFYLNAPVVGPDGSFLPPGTYACPDGGTFDTNNILSFDPENGTPDATNDPFCGDAALTLISAIQGTGSSVTDTSTTFEVQAIVVGDHQENFEFDGFFIQEEDADADADPNTSEGIFVYCGNGGGNCPDVAYGDQVTVTAQASDFFGMSQLTPNSSADVVIDSSNNPIPTPATVSFPVPAPVNGVDYLERFEGMYITIDTPMTITEYFDYDRRGRITLWTDGTVSTSNSVRPYQFTAQNAPDVTGFENYEATFETQVISLDDGSNAENDETTLPAPYPPGGFSPANTFRGGDVATGVDGVLNFTFGDWRVQGWDPSAGTETDGIPSLTFTDLNDRPATPPTLAAGNLRVVSFNVLNYFNGDGQGGGFPTARGADTANEFDRQRTKIIEAICLLDADIVGLNEIENDYIDGANSAIADLVSGLNASATCGNRVYDYVDPGANIGTDAIAVGFVYDTNVVSLLQSPSNPAVLDDNAPFVDAPVFDGPDTNRNPLAATFIDNNEGELTVIVNHFKSKGGSGTGDNADQGDGQGNWNARRTAASQAILDWIALSPTGSSDDDYLVIGDLNAYDEEDPVTTLEASNFTDLVDSYQGDDAYGYVFSGQWGYLDYAMSSSTLTSQITGAANWNINADEPDALDYDESFNPSSWYEPNQYRSSDHDPVVVEIQLAGAVEPPTPNINLLQNPMFNNGITGWGLNGQYEFSVVNGVLEFYRQRPGWRGAVLFQTIDEAIPAGAPMRVNVSLGNNSDVAKSVQILLRSGDFQDVISCSVTIPANSFLRGVTIEDVTSTDWTSGLFAVRVYNQDGLAAVRVDNTIVQYVPNSSISSYNCSGYDTPEGTNLMRNGNFSAGLLEWILFGDYAFTINSGVMEFYRPAAAPRIATLFQYIAGNVDSGAPLQTQLQLGNSSPVEKTVSVIVRNADWSDFFRCDYTIPANTPLTQVTLLGTTSVPWSDATLLVRALDADGEAAIQVDNASFVYDTTLDTSTQCSTPSFSAGDTAEIPDGMKAPTTIMPDAGSQLDNGGAAPAPVAPPNPGGMPDIPGF